MNKKLVFGLSLLLLSPCLLLTRLSSIVTKASDDYPVHNLNTGLNYTTIQEAINANETLDGHTILVDAGAYYENVVVNKTISLVGEDKSNTIIDGGGRFTRVVEIVVNNVTVQNLTITNSNQIGDWGSNNIVCVSQSNDTLIQNNILTNPSGFAAGVVLMYSFRDTISGNNIAANSNEGVRLWYSSNNTVSENTVTNDSEDIDIDSGSSYNTVTGNNVAGGWEGIGCIESFNTISGNVITNASFSGISLYGSSNTVSENVIEGSETGIFLYGYGHNVSENTISTCKYDAIMVYCNSSSIYANNLTDNGQAGIHIEISSSYNKFYQNNLIDNTRNVLTVALLGNPPMPNTWDDGYPSGGNYWSDYDGTDANHDGIGDNAYVIDANNADNYPLMTPYIIPEFPSSLILPLFFIATLLAVIIYKKKGVKTSQS